MEARAVGWRRAGKDESVSARDSVTEVGDAALVQEPAIEIERGAVLAGRYQVEAVIGKGGSGTVLRAFDRVAEQLVAIKILRSDLARDPRWVERFSRELRLGRQLQHPNVCRIFDIGEADGHRFLTMELATHGTLRDAIEGPPRSLDGRVADACALVAGLTAIHDAGIVHRDVKPENLLRMGDGRLVLSDFGLATNPSDAPTTTIMVGTPTYMAPEIVMGATATPRSDIFAAGMVMHEVLFGTRPSRPHSRIRKRLRTGRKASRIEKSLASVCARCLSEDPDDRPGDANALERLLTSAIERPSRRVYRRAIGWGALAAATLSAALILRTRLWTPAAAGSRQQHTITLVTSGRPTDWRSLSTIIAERPGRAHCFDVLPGGKNLRLIWGSPRRAEDVDLESGRGVPAPLLAATYRADCPQLSKDGRALLFTQLSDQGPSQIQIGASDGSDAKVLITGTQPLWLPNGEEFLFNLDASHAAIFSIPTMSFRLLPQGRATTTAQIYEKAVDPSGDRTATLYNDGQGNRLLVIHAIPSFELLAEWRLSHRAANIAFHDGNILLSDASESAALTRLDWRTGEQIRLGTLAGATRLSLLSTGRESFLLRQTRTIDIWLFDRDHPDGLPVTHDGESYTASRSPFGDVLVQSRISDGRIVIVKYGSDTRKTRLTDGPSDCCVSFGRDGSTWLYSDYQRRTIRICDSGVCRDLWHSDSLPTWPVMSPDGSRVAFVTQLGSPRLHVVDTRGGNERDLGPTSTECPPVWSAPNELWSFSGAGSVREWVEIDAATARKTGRSRAALTYDPDRLSCGAESEPVGSAFFQPVRPVVRETTELRRLRSATEAD